MLHCWKAHWLRKRWKKFGPGGLEFAKHMMAPEEQRCDAEEALRSRWMLQNGANGCCVIS